MPEYIERELLPERKGYWDDDFGAGWDACLDEIAKLPAADVRPNIPGKWLRENNPSYSPFDNSGEYRYRCSRCEQYNHRESAFCPDCGSPMEGGEQDGV